MHFQYLIEDQSSTRLIEILMEKLKETYPDMTYDCKPFRGIGGFTKKNTVKETKTGKLLNDLATYMRGFNRSLQGIPAAIVVVLDNDDRNTEEFRQQLESVALQNRITADYFFCIAVEEVEAWLLGDEQALLAAYPKAKVQVLRSYEQDSICGTWELLADVVYPGGIRQIRKEFHSFMDIGSLKAEWAHNIGKNMNIEINKSPSFQRYIAELRKRLETCAF